MIQIGTGMKGGWVRSERLAAKAGRDRRSTDYECSMAVNNVSRIRGLDKGVILQSGMLIPSESLVTTGKQIPSGEWATELDRRTLSARPSVKSQDILQPYSGAHWPLRKTAHERTEHGRRHSVA